MRTMQLREAKAKLSAIVDAAEHGETTIVTKHGRPVAQVGPVRGEESVESKPNLIEYLKTMPPEIPIRRNRSRARRVEF